MNRKILLSLSLIVFVAAVSITATGAFFNDKETSTGNTFTAGSIDLKISNQSYVSNKTTGALVESPSTSWISGDLNPVVNHFFDFADIKPGDIGEDTIDLTVNNNDSWACAQLDLTSNKDNTCTAPELADDQTCGTGDANFNGELAQGIEFVWWSDDGDNVLEKGEEVTKYYLGPDTISNLLGTDNKLDLTLADSKLNFFDHTNKLVNPNDVVNPIAGGVTHYIGKGWCFGHMVLNPVDDGTGGPLQRGTGFTCDGTNVNNAAQTDSLTADITFTAVQSRNNMQYLCPEHVPQTITNGQ
jgi:predicted ribosomally synthesized peptide with SipW-like signal peptide